jgi:hypothetical protein
MCGYFKLSLEPLWLLWDQKNHHHCHHHRKLNSHDQNRHFGAIWSIGVRTAPLNTSTVNHFFLTKLGGIPSSSSGEGIEYIETRFNLKDSIKVTHALLKSAKLGENWRHESAWVTFPEFLRLNLVFMCSMPFPLDELGIPPNFVKKNLFTVEVFNGVTVGRDIAARQLTMCGNHRLALQLT